MSLILFSPSTEKHISDWNYDEKLLVSSPPSINLLNYPKTNKQILAVGGGSVIDYAKTISTNKITAVPTTYSGASRTSHAVLWDYKNQRKVDVQTPKPKTVIVKEYFEKCTPSVLQDSYYDCLAHLVESAISKKANIQSTALIVKAQQLLGRSDLPSLIKLSLLAGDAIEITGTNIFHSLSYPLTLKYSIPHARALRYLLRKDFQLSFDVEEVVRMALDYPKIHDAVFPVTKNLLRGLLLW